MKQASWFILIGIVGGFAFGSASVNWEFGRSIYRFLGLKPLVARIDIFLYMSLWIILGLLLSIGTFTIGKKLLK